MLFINRTSIIGFVEFLRRKVYRGYLISITFSAILASSSVLFGMLILKTPFSTFASILSFSTLSGQNHGLLELAIREFASQIAPSFLSSFFSSFFSIDTTKLLFSSILMLNHSSSYRERLPQLDNPYRILSR